MLKGLSSSTRMMFVLTSSSSIESLSSMLKGLSSSST